MADILHRFPIRASADLVFAAFSSCEGLDAWWTLRSAGVPELGAVYVLDFGPGYEWRGTVTRCAPGRAFEWTMTGAMADWVGSRVGCVLTEEAGVTTVDFYHAGWAEATEHFRVSSYCWAMYLRLLRRYVEFGEVVPYATRLDA